MKLIEAITRIDKLKHNPYSREEKLQWLSTLDTMVKTQLMDTHQGCEAAHFCGYSESTPADTVLLVPAPYDELYLWWLAARIDYHNGELIHYNNSIALFNNGYRAYADHYIRNHTPLTCQKGFG